MKSRYRYLLCPWIILEQEYSKNWGLLIDLP
jgi:hypothetical protein